MNRPVRGHLNRVRDLSPSLHDGVRADIHEVADSSCAKKQRVVFDGVGEHHGVWLQHCARAYRFQVKLAAQG